MIAASVVCAALMGAVVGSVLTVVAWRVPVGLPLSAGQSADGLVQDALWRDVPMLRIRGRRADTGWWRGAVAVRPPLLELITGALFALVVVRFGLSWSLPAYLTLAAAAVLLSVVDLQHRRLPDAIVGPFAVAAVALIALAAWGQGSWESLVRAILGGVILFVLYLVMALISPGALGMGDVKLAGVLGLYLTYLGWRTLLFGGAGGFIIAATVSCVLLAAGRATRQTLVPFGPSMLFATVIAVFISAP